MSELELLNLVMTPGIALLILSTTIRAGNIRLAIFELTKTLHSELDDSPAYLMYITRMDLIVKGLQQLYLSLLLLIFGSVFSYLFSNLSEFGREALGLTSVVAFILVFLAVWKLVAESKLVYRSTKLASHEIARLDSN